MVFGGVNFLLVTILIVAFSTFSSHFLKNQEPLRTLTFNEVITTSDLGVPIDIGVKYSDRNWTLLADISSPSEITNVELIQANALFVHPTIRKENYGKDLLIATVHTESGTGISEVQEWWYDPVTLRKIASYPISGHYAQTTDRESLFLRGRVIKSNDIFSDGLRVECNLEYRDGEFNKLLKSEEIIVVFKYDKNVEEFVFSQQDSNIQRERLDNLLEFPWR